MAANYDKLGHKPPQIAKITFENFRFFAIFYQKKGVFCALFIQNLRQFLHYFKKPIF
jgi:hypothetical protein